MPIGRYPISLPGPSAAPYAPTDLRMASSLPGPRQLRPRQRDRAGTEEVDFCYSHDQLAVFTAWLEADLEKAGAWFVADWPRPQGGAAARRFIGYPSLPVFYPIYGWHVHATCAVRTASAAELEAAGFPSGGGGGGTSRFIGFADFETEPSADYSGTTDSELNDTVVDLFAGVVPPFDGIDTIDWSFDFVLANVDDEGDIPTYTLSGLHGNRMTIHMVHSLDWVEGTLTIGATINGTEITNQIRAVISGGETGGAHIVWGPL